MPILDDRVVCWWSYRGFINLRARVDSSALVSGERGGWNGEVVDMIDWVALKELWVGESCWRERYLLSREGRKGGCTECLVVEEEFQTL